jgi:vacuolar protein sorting-associated protein 3
VRRDAFACVADAHSYALLDVDRQLKIPLFPISSLDESQSGLVGGRAEDISGRTGNRVQRSTSSVQPSHSTLIAEDRGHSRSTSLGTFMSGGFGRQGQGNGSKELSRETHEGVLREASPGPSKSPIRSIQQERNPGQSLGPSEKPLPPPPPEPSASEQIPILPASPPAYLKPHIASPTPQEFLLVTGTGISEPGVGMFVNLEGDVTRSTLEFDRYPLDLVVDGRGVGIDFSITNAEDDEEGYVLATMVRDLGQGVQYGIEIQRWDLDPAEMSTHKSWLQIPNVPELSTAVDSGTPRVGIRSVMQAGDINFEEVVEKLRLRRFHPFATSSIGASTHSLQSLDSRTATSLERVSKEKELFDSQDIQSEEGMPEGWEESRDEEEFHFAKRLGHSRSRVAVWSQDKIWWAVRNPLAVQLDASLESDGLDVQNSTPRIETRQIIEIINSLRGREAKTEVEYVSFGYLRQRAGLLLYISLMSSSTKPSDIETRAMEEALLDGGLDPRVILALAPLLRNEVIGGKKGIWVHGGVRDTAEEFISGREAAVASDGQPHPVHEHTLQFLRRFLTAWRRKKGFGSVADESEVFRTVDASLLVVLLELDKLYPKGPARAGSIRSELNDLVDHGVDCFERAISILESYRRLYVLSRLYQSRKLANEVLATWRRIVEGEVDEGGEFSDGEQKVREYLTIVRNPTAVQEYGVWLASRNPRLGIQVFADDKSRVKFEPTQVVEILRRGAPDAVKEYLEYLVFGKNHTVYVNELITYYLDVVTQKLEASEDARAILAQTYESYRALRPPKPTYRQFITENALQEDWWHSRLRLLQLLGGSHGSASEYDVAAILARIEPFIRELVPEVIILDGRQSRHQEALKLLTHDLGDYDTAINYCLLGGYSIYHPISGTRTRDALPSQEEQSKLFKFLLAEFLEIVDISDRVEQTAGLLERFGGWFDVAYVLSLIPDTWSVELVSSFLVSALRRIVKERSETMVAKALSGAENLNINADLIGKIEEIGPTIEAQN